MAHPDPKSFEVRRMLDSGGWAVVWRGNDEYEAAAVHERWQRMCRSKNVIVDLAEVAQ